jgi:hypothetical protein
MSNHIAYIDIVYLRIYAPDTLGLAFVGIDVEARTLGTQRGAPILVRRRRFHSKP